MVYLLKELTFHLIDSLNFFVVSISLISAMILIISSCLLFGGLVCSYFSKILRYIIKLLGFSLILLLIISMDVCVCLLVHVSTMGMQLPMVARGWCKNPEIRVTGVCESPDLGAGN